MKKHISSFFGLFVIALVSSTVLVGAIEPSQNPPAGNTAAPINTSDVSQVKVGGLSLGSLVVAGGSHFNGPVGIADQTPDGDLLLDVEGAIGARQYCDQNGQNCMSSIVPPTCIGANTYLQWDGSEWVCDQRLYGGSHTTADCTALGGSVYDAGVGYICQVPGSSCPVGWSQLNNWSTTESVHCHDTLHSHPEGWEPLRTDYECDTGGHSFADAAAESCTAYHDGQYRYYSGWRKKTRQAYHETTCTANTVAVGCY